jgi:small subunit ribosomal protein S21
MVNPLKAPFGVSSARFSKEGIIKEVKKHSFFLKPGERRRLKSKLAQKLKRKKVRRYPLESDPKTSPRQ